MRYELKTVLPQNFYRSVLNRMKNSRFHIREIYAERQINNIYFDTSNYSDYYANIYGNAIRAKYRIRWYGDLLQESISPVLENKFKTGLLSGKHSMVFPNFAMDKCFSITQYMEEIKKSMRAESYNAYDVRLLNEFLVRKPALINKYSRRYYQTQNKKIRVTIDKDLLYVKPIPALLISDSFGAKDERIVLEFKFDSDDFNEGAALINDLGYRIDHNSKYINGIQAIG